MQAHFDYCQSLVRERSRERFLASLFAPEAERAFLFALYAFDSEIAHIPDAVREPMAGEIRLQWWREALAGERNGEAAANPVATALIETIATRELPVTPFYALIDARQFDLTASPMEDMNALREYLDATTGATIELAARVLNGAADLRDAAIAAGRADGITRLLRSLGRDVSNGRLFLPLDLLAKHGVHTASVLGGENSAPLRAALAELRAEAAANYRAVQSMELLPSVLPAFLPIISTLAYLARMAKAAYDPFRSDIGLSRLRTQFSIWRAARSGKL